jgi:hypothetical protein
MDNKIETIFRSVVNDCKRSFTKKNLHTDPVKEVVLAAKLEKTFSTYGEAIAGQFQTIYEGQNPALSFLFAQVSNAMIEKTFHHGACYPQAAYALIELIKTGIFNVSLMCSRTGNALTEHWYLLRHNEFTLKRLPTLVSPESTIYIRVNPKSLTQDLLFFDTWSDQLCPFIHLKSLDRYTSEIKKTDQALFRPFLHLFKNEVGVIENIILCLNEYERRLQELPLNKEVIPEQITKLFSPDDIEFQNEIVMLFNPEACRSKLLLTIESYKKAFQEQRNLLGQTMDVKKEDIQQKDKKLSATTCFFFKEKEPLLAQWKIYPKDKLVGSYVGHEVRFKTMQNTSTQQAGEFVTHLNGEGFKAELKTAKGNPSVVVDLTASTPKI